MPRDKRDWEQRKPERRGLGDEAEEKEHSKQEVDEGKGVSHLQLCLE